MIDYSPRLGQTQPEAFETLATVTMATSWSSNQPFSVFRKRSRLRSHEACCTVVAIAGVAATAAAVGRSHA